MKLNNKKYPSWIDHYASSVYRMFKGMDLRTMEPLDGYHFHPLYSDLWLGRIYQAVKKFKDKKFSISKHANYLPNPSTIRALIEFFVLHWYNIVRFKMNFKNTRAKEIFDFLEVKTDNKLTEDISQVIFKEVNNKKYKEILTEDQIKTFGDMIRKYEWYDIYNTGD